MSKFLLQFKYSVLSPIKEKEFLFWMFAFPLLLFTVYFLAFSGVDNTADIKVDYGITVGNILEPVFKSVGVFNVIVEEEEVLKDKLISGEIDSYLDADYELVTTDTDIGKNVSAIVTNGIRRHGIAMTIKHKEELGIVAENDEIVAMPLKEVAPLMLEVYQLEALYHGVSSFAFKPIIDYKNQGSGALKTILFASFSMISMYGVFFGLRTAHQVQGYLSAFAVRIGVSPCRKSHLVLTSFLVGLLFSLLLDFVMMMFVTYVLKIQIFSEYRVTVLILIVASIFSNALGIVIGSIKAKESVKKEAIVSNVLVFVSLISGMFGNFRAIRAIESTAPILNKLNPIYLVNQSLFRVNYLDSTEGVYMDMGILLLATAVLLVLIVLMLRRKTYDSL